MLRDPHAIFHISTGQSERFVYQVEHACWSACHGIQTGLSHHHRRNYLLMIAHMYKRGLLRCRLHNYGVGYKRVHVLHGMGEGSSDSMFCYFRC